MFFKEIEKSMMQIERLFNERTLEEFMNCSYCDLANYHFSLGIWIRTNLLNSGLLFDLLSDGGICNKDDMSALLIQLFHIYVHLKYK